MPDVMQMIIEKAESEFVEAMLFGKSFVNSQ